MDVQQALQTARDLLGWAGPLVAGGALAQAGGGASDQSAQLVQRAWRMIQGWLARDEDAGDDLRKLEKRPEDTDRQQLVAKAIAQMAASNATMSQELAGLKQALDQLQPSAGSRTHQAFVSGNAQVGMLNVGDFHGDLTVGPMDFSKKTTIIGARTGAPPTPAKAADLATRPTLPATLSADGTHFTYGHALLIGVGVYQRAGLSTPTTTADAARLGELLRDPQIAGYPPQQVRVLLDAAATRAGILDALDGFAQQLANAPDATAVIFFAGHGKQHSAGYALLPHDYTPDNIAGSTVSAADFHAKIDAIRRCAKRLLVVLNCCHSGGIGGAVLDDSDAAPGDTPPADFFRALATGSGQVVISAARPWQKAGAGALHAPENTLFGARLLEALRGQAPGAGAGIGVFELFSYLSAQVPADARQIDYEGKPLAQEPLLYAHQLDANIAIALRPNWQGGTLDADLASTIDELAAAEIALASYTREADAPVELRQRRDALLGQFEHEA